MYSPARWATFGLLAATLALAGCGRKAGLDLPPQSSMQPTVDSTQAPAAANEGAASKGNALFGTSSGDDTQPTAAKGKKKPFLLDPILD
jgi:predicted small lipoprotein YifL